MTTVTEKELTVFLQYCEANKIAYSVDENPTAEKVSRIKLALERKAELVDISIKFFKNTLGLNVSR